MQAFLKSDYCQNRQGPTPANKRIQGKTKSNPKTGNGQGRQQTITKTRKQSKVKNKKRQGKNKAIKTRRNAQKCLIKDKQDFTMCVCVCVCVCVFECSLKSPPDRKQGCMQTVARHGVL